MADSWRDVDWATFCEWVSGRKVVETIDEYNGKTRLVFEDGTEAEVRSNYDGPYSDVTPGSGVECPTVRIKE